METSLKDIQEFTLDANVDFRGEIYTTYKDHFLGLKFDHDKICTRSKNVLVGIHGDFSTTKLVTCLYGKVYCVLVDNRKDSIDYLKHKTFILSRENKKQLLKQLFDAKKNQYNFQHDIIYFSKNNIKTYDNSGVIQEKEL